uniref:Uncharacterized protein, isoform N n=1 Tax=Drosophila melanogaster TaxID=7227 RepID=A0A0B4KG26_DROME|nr:uncharacterized protein Dmel_CG12963, isoform N [Drosophila melanogaster]AGB93536.1 uncharacterized protein Dmel_CG12963, isoform N [Drosophila melanogaster]|eukprot:NP_001261004.1 uncharacterized protein Dmel_CG12963, isoform N [Drosophila melanogaster]
MEAIDIFYISLLFFLVFVLCYKSRRNINSGDYDTESFSAGGQSPDRNVFNAQEDPSSNRYGDIFFIEPGSVEANRIRDQLEKDEKDLPSYDEVMRMCNLTTPTAAAAGMPVPQSPLGVPSPIGIAALPAPPYSETDPHSSSAAEATVIAMEPMEPSTSRAAQIPPSSGSGPPAPLPTTAV